MHDDDETPPTPEEEREAAALARLLEGETMEGETLPADVTETASFFRAHRQGSQGPTLEPDNTRLDAIRRKVWDGGAPRDEHGRTKKWWLFGGLGTLAAAGAMVALVFITPPQEAAFDVASKEAEMAPAAPAPQPPAPPANGAAVAAGPSTELATRTLLTAQRKALSDPKIPLDDLQREMSTYRERLLRRWSETYAPHAGDYPLGPERFAAR